VLIIPSLLLHFGLGLTLHSLPYAFLPIVEFFST
jgi:hypothetical protein